MYRPTFDGDLYGMLFLGDGKTKDTKGSRLKSLRTCRFVVTEVGRKVGRKVHLRPLRFGIAGMVWLGTKNFTWKISFKKMIEDGMATSVMVSGPITTGN